MNRRTLLLGTAGAALVAAAGGWISNQTRFVRPAAAEDTGTTPAQTPPPAAGAAPEIVPDIPLGSPDAKVTMIEYGSFTCPHCADFHNEVFGQLKKDYIDTGKVRFIFREVYFDKFGLWAGMVAQCGGALKYYGIVDMIYTEQRDWFGDGKAQTISDNLRKIGLRAGLTKEQLDACMNDQAHAQAMVATYQKHATDDSIDATPSFVINGQKYSNMSYADMKKILDEKLAG